jgi:copper transport protein
VSYRVVSSDGHPIAGGFSFSIEAPSTQAGPVERDAAAQVDPWVRGTQSVGRFATYAGAALLAGPLVLLLALWPRRLATDGARRLAWTGWWLLTGGTAVTFLLQEPYASGASLPGITASGIADTAGTLVGRALLARIAILLAAVPVIRRITGGRGTRLGPADTVLAVLVTGAALLTFPYAGHAGSSPARLLTVPAGAVHVAAMAFWLGGLVVLGRYLLPRSDPRELAAILPVWSRWAAYAVVALVASGGVAALIEVGSLAALTGTTYGRLVVAKVVWLGAILVVAASARGWVRQRFALPVAHALADPPPAEEDGRSAGDAVGETPADVAEERPDETRDDASLGATLRRRVAIELALATVVVGLATALVQVTPGRAAEDPAEAQQLPHTATVRAGVIDLQVDLDPAAAGNNSLHLTAYDAAGAPLTVLEWTAEAARPDQGVQLDVALLPIADNHAVGEVALPSAGDWRFTFTLRTSDIDAETVTHTIRVR